MICSAKIDSELAEVSKNTVIKPKEVTLMIVDVLASVEKKIWQL